MPKRYIKLRYILYGRYIEWTGDVIKTAKIHEEINEISTTLSINTASISILDAKNDFDISNENGSWRSVQKTQEVTFTENKNAVVTGDASVEALKQAVVDAGYEVTDVK